MSDAPTKVLVIDVGGSHVKLLATGVRRPIRVVSGTTMTARQMVDAVKAATADWEYDAVSIGYPGVVKNNAAAAEPAHLGRGWIGFDFAAAFDRPVKFCNDAA